MAKLTRDEVKHVAKLANLPLTPEETEKFQEQLSKVIDYIDLLNELDIDDVEATTHPVDLTNITRDDKPSSGDTLKVEDAVSGSEKVHNNYFMVDAVIDKTNE